MIEGLSPAFFFSLPLPFSSQAIPCPSPSLLLLLALLACPPSSFFRLCVWHWQGVCVSKTACSHPAHQRPIGSSRPCRANAGKQGLINSPCIDQTATWQLSKLCCLQCVHWRRLSTGHACVAERTQPREGSSNIIFFFLPLSSIYLAQPTLRLRPMSFILGGKHARAVHCTCRKDQLFGPRFDMFGRNPQPVDGYPSPA